jgi:hypothetical protein
VAANVTCGGASSPHTSTAVVPTTLAAAPTPSPTATPEPGPTREPDIDPSACTNPTPPPLARIDVKILIWGASRLILDATPIVGPDPDYCERIGYTDRRRFCPPRPEGNPERGACDDLLVGRALDTDRYGPTWTVNGKNCVNYAVRPPFCNNHPDNQFLVEAFGPGMYEACSRSNVCGGIQIPAP